MTSPGRTWKIRDHELRLDKPLVMGIVNVTPDSFSDGGIHATADAAIGHALELVRQGADILDIGGESTRPGSEPTSLAEELARVIPVVRGIVSQSAVPISVDTTKAPVAAGALEAGAHIINDISALADPRMGEVVRATPSGVDFDAHAGYARNHATEPVLRRRGFRSPGVSRGEVAVRERVGYSGHAGGA